VKLLAPACVAVSSADGDGQGGSASLVPAVQAFTHKSAKVRSGALRKTVADLVASGDKPEDLQRQRLLAGVALKAVEDEGSGLNMVMEALHLKALWSSLSQAAERL
jgi:hypothetical protein